MTSGEGSSGLGNSKGSEAGVRAGLGGGWPDGMWHGRSLGLLAPSSPASLFLPPLLGCSPGPGDAGGGAGADGAARQQLEGAAH